MPRYDRARFTRSRESARLTDDGLWDLLDQARDGDARAFGDFFDATAGEVFGYVCRRLFGDRESAEEITSDVYVAAWRNLDRVRRIAANPTAWLMTIARRRVIDYHRARQRRNVIAGGDAADLVSYGSHRHAWASGVTVTVTGAPMVAEAAESHCIDREDARELSRALWSHVRELSPDQHRVLRCRYWMGWSVEVTADVLGKAPAAVKSLQYRALQNLRAQLRGTELDPAAGAVLAAVA